MSVLAAARVAVEDDVAAALAAALVDAPEVLVRLDRPGWAAALAASSGPLAVVVGDGAAQDALAEALGHDALVELVVAGPPGRAAAVVALVGGDAEAVALPDGGEATVVRLPTDAPLAPPAALAGLLRGPGRRRTPSPALPWRVAVHGATAAAWLGSAARRAPLPGSLPQDDPAGHVDVLLTSDDAPDRPTIVEQSIHRGARVAQLGRGLPLVEDLDGERVTVDDPSRGVGSVRPVDGTAVGPDGWVRDPSQDWLLVLEEHAAPAVVDAAVALVGGREHLRTVGHGADVALEPRDTGAVLHVARTLRGVVDLPDLHVSPAAHAHRLATWALAGVPVLLGELPTATRRLLGDELSDVLTGARRDELADPDLRERRTVLARRAAWRTHSTTVRWRDLGPDLRLPVPPLPTVTMVLSTNRPDFLTHGVDQALRQRWPSRELVVALHGDGFAPGTAADLAARVGDALPLTVLPVDDREPLGEALNQAAAVGCGDWISKVDDDDWYSPDHLLDLLLAAEHAQADLVGKAAEFVFLSEPDETLRRFGTGQHTASRTLAGGTLTLRRDVWRDVGGFARVSLGEDRVLVGDVADAGGVVHRTHGFGYLLHRHGRHAWEVDADYFRDQAVATRAGRAHDWSLT